MVSVGDSAAPTLEALENKKVGIIDMLGRKNSKKLVQTLLEKSVKVKGVTKPRDLLPLVNFKVVDLLMVDDLMLDYLKKVSTQTFSTRPLTLNTRLNLAAVHNGSHKKSGGSIKEQIKACVDEMSTATYKQTYFAIDQWNVL